MWKMPHVKHHFGSWQTARIFTLRLRRCVATSAPARPGPGIGPITASALVAPVGDLKNSDGGQQLAAWLGLVPREHSSGGKSNLLGMSKRGDGYLRTVPIHSARSVNHRAGQGGRIRAAGLTQWCSATTRMSRWPWPTTMLESSGHRPMADVTRRVRAEQPRSRVPSGLAGCCHALAHDNRSLAFPRSNQAQWLRAPAGARSKLLYPLTVAGAAQALRVTRRAHLLPV